MTEASIAAQVLAEQAELLDGIEVHKDDWPAAEEAVRLGLASSLGPARGPNRIWVQEKPRSEEEPSHED